MRDDVVKLLGLRRLPGRITAEQAAKLLGFETHDIPVLLKSKELRALGCPSQQSVKYFASSAIEELSRNEKWLSHATRLIQNNWSRQNQKRKTALRPVPAGPCRQTTAPIDASEKNSNN